jgi:tetratricopeptide (TPR) repeat protein
MYRNKGEFDKAIADFSKAIELDPNYAEAYFNRAYAYHRKGGEVAKARSDLEEMY